MTYNKQNLPRYVETAGKITILTALSGILIFAFVFILNIGKTELTRVEAATGTATTSVTVLNTPPVWVVGEEGREEIESSTSTPTNSGDTISWVGKATDANGSPYYLLICSTASAPSSTNNGAPVCNGGIQWGVSATTTSGSTARVSTTTTEAAATTNVWYAWVCDYDAGSRCYATSSQGIAGSATNSSPFYVNHRPTFTSFNNNGPKAPSATITFNSTSSDSDSGAPLNDLVYLVVCGTASYSTTTNQCGPGDTVASSTIGGATSNASTSRILPYPMQDTNYNGFPYVFDKFGHSATGSTQGVNVNYAVSNVAPTVLGSTIQLGGSSGVGTNIILTVEAGQTLNNRLSYIVTDANSCINATGTPEIVGAVVSVFRSGVGTTTCNGTAGSYDNNSCYPSGVATTTWNLVCTASSTSCTGATDDTKQFDCTFPLWFTADPTDGTATDTPYYAQHWTAGVAGIDDNNATGSMASSTSGSIELLSYVAIALQTNLIAYDQLQPNQNMANLTATTTVRNVGNTGLNEVLMGDSMCTGYTPLNPCKVSATSTIPQDQQRYATSAVAFLTGAQLLATSTGGATLDIRIPKPLFTSTSTTGTTYWGIAVPAAIQLAGAYTGQNTFIAARSATNTW